MGDDVGPTLSVFTPGAADAAAIDNLLRRTVYLTQRLGEKGDRWEFVPNVDGRGEPTGCLCTLAIVPFGMEAGGSQIDTALIEEARAKLPFMPQMTLQLDNFCRKDEAGHRVLARVAADLADLFGGLIDVDGADYVLLVARALVVATPGSEDPAQHRHSYALSYDIDGLRTGTTYCVTAQLMREWSEHPAFWLMV
jgi:Family of unknown function (DUF6368)